jgi:hypothetical protein
LALNFELTGVKYKKNGETAKNTHAIWYSRLTVSSLLRIF